MPGNGLRGNNVRGYAWILLGLTSLFVTRVIAQLIQTWHPVAFLPSFEVWQSGALPYPLLLVSQIIITGCCLRVVWRMFKCAVVPLRKKGRIMFVLGGLYGLVMSIRLVIGLMVAPNHFWFGATLPTVFHFVLAAFLLVYARFHLSGLETTISHPQKANA